MFNSIFICKNRATMGRGIEKNCLPSLDYINDRSMNKHKKNISKYWLKCMVKYRTEKITASLCWILIGYKWNSFFFPEKGYNIWRPKKKSACQRKCCENASNIAKYHARKWRFKCFCISKDSSGDPCYIEVKRVNTRCQRKFFRCDWDRNINWLKTTNENMRI